MIECLHTTLLPSRQHQHEGWRVVWRGGWIERGGIASLSLYSHSEILEAQLYRHLFRSSCDIEQNVRPRVYCDSVCLAHRIADSGGHLSRSRLSPKPQTSKLIPLLFLLPELIEDFLHVVPSLLLLLLHRDPLLLHLHM